MSTGFILTLDVGFGFMEGRLFSEFEVAEGDVVDYPHEVDGAEVQWIPSVVLKCEAYVPKIREAVPIQGAASSVSR